jgi:hypothetical protein
MAYLGLDRVAPRAIEGLIGKIVNGVVVTAGAIANVAVVTWAGPVPGVARTAWVMVCMPEGTVFGFQPFAVPSPAPPAKS